MLELWRQMEVASDSRVAAAEAADRGVASPWGNMLFGLPTAAAPRPTQEFELVWEGPALATGAYFTGAVFTDGSGSDVDVSGAARAGGAVVSVDRNGLILLSARAPVPGFLQTVPHAELLFVLVACRHVLPPMDLAFDCYGIMHGLVQGREWCERPARLLEHVWRQLYAVLDGLTWAIWEDGHDRPNVEVTFRWIPAHTTMSDVAERRIAYLDHMSNKIADALTRRAATSHRLSTQLTDGLRVLRPLVAGAAEFVGFAPRRATYFGKWPDVEVQPCPPKRGGRPGRRLLSFRAPVDGGRNWVWEPRADLDDEEEPGVLGGSLVSSGCVEEALANGGSLPELRARFRCSQCHSFSLQPHRRRRKRCRAVRASYASLGVVGSRPGPPGASPAITPLIKI